jgi:2-polyprenyl-3-methyl-5-hydroxy-6-metoxy-1,4-benzoquinol methylase
VERGTGVEQAAMVEGDNRYASGSYLERNPTWHVEESEWKARQVLRMLHNHELAPQTVAEAGCGAGEVLRQLQLAMDSACYFSGYDISPQAIEMCRSRANTRLQFHLADLTQVADAHFDVLLVLDVIEHLEDYYTFMRALRQKAQYLMFHMPLELSVQTILRPGGLLKTQAAYGHLHYFTKETALQSVHNAGYHIIDYFYTARAIEEPTHELPRRLLKLPRRVLFAINENLASRVLGGFSLLVLAQGSQ